MSNEHERVDLETPDIAAERRAAFESLFPGVLSDGVLDSTRLGELLDTPVTAPADGTERFGLMWAGKQDAVRSLLAPGRGTLEPELENSIDFDDADNVFIEGDNLEVLKLLQKAYNDRVKLIYIDPPYNTGNDFVYPDTFQDNIRNYLELTGQVEGGRKVSSNTEASGRFHTDWLSMIYPRLKIARNLLRDDGVLLISIDDHELDDLRCVCNELFGEENFIANMVWEKGRKNDAKLVSVGHEYIVMYAKSLGLLRETKAIWREEKPGARDIWQKYLELRKVHGDNDTAIESDLSAWYSSLPKTHPAKKWSRYRRVDANGPWRDHDISWPGGGGPRYDVLHPATKQPCKVPDDGWRFSKSEEMERQIKLGLVQFRTDHSEPPFRKAHIRPVMAEIEIEDEGQDSPEDEEAEFATQVRGSYFYKQSQVAVKALRDLLGEKAFNNPKDHLELAKLFDYVSSGDPNAIVVDFFAGSGSTGHAIMELNSSDGGSRRFFLVQLPEPLSPDDKEQKIAARYCDHLNKPRNLAEITKERLRRAARKIKDANPMFAGDLGFRVFKLDSSNIRAWEPNRDDLDDALQVSIEHLKVDRSEADILYELLLKLGIDLCVPIEKRVLAGKDVYAIGSGVLLACLGDKISRAEVEPLAQGIIEWHKSLAPAGDTICVFRDSAFSDDVAKTNLVAILHQNGLQSVRSL